MAPLGAIIQLQFMDFDIEELKDSKTCVYDYLEVWEKTIALFYKSYYNQICVGQLQT